MDFRVSFFDNTWIPLGIKDVDTWRIQNDLHKVYIWLDTNNMKFNASKFKLQWYIKEQEIKTAATYKSYDD